MNALKSITARLGSNIKRNKNEEQNKGLFDNTESQVDDRPFMDEKEENSDYSNESLDQSHSELDPVSPGLTRGLASPLDGDLVESEEDSFVSKPIKILVGHQAEISKKDLKSYLIAKANESFIKEITYISIRKSSNGYYWEMHEGGPGKGMLSSILKTLETQDIVYLPSEDRVLKVTKTNMGGIRALLLSERESPELTKNIVAMDKMASISSSGNGLLFFGLVSVALSMTALLLAFIIKYSVINKQESVEATRNVTTTPISEIQKLRETLKLDGVYVESMVLNGDGKYLIKTAIEKNDSSAETSSEAFTDNKPNKNKDKNIEESNTGEQENKSSHESYSSTPLLTENAK